MTGGGSGGVLRDVSPYAPRGVLRPLRVSLGAGAGRDDAGARAGAAVLPETGAGVTPSQGEGAAAGSVATIRLVLADVDGTLVTQEKVLTDQAVAAVGRLRDAGILFAVTSGRPPRGMEMLVEPLGLQTPIAAFNGGLIVNPDMTVIERKVLPEDLVVPASDLMHSFDLSVWLYRGTEWYVPDLEGPHVAREAWTVKFEPVLMTGVEGLTHDVAKMVGVSDDHDAVSRGAAAMQERFGDQVTAAPSQPYYLDVTHPRANKGEVVKYLAQRYGLSTDEIATIGDQPNDVLMFAHSGLSIAMGNADPQVQRCARRVTDTSENNGFAAAVDRFVLTGQKR